ncbi:G patch domain-containing 3 [Melia azedarach]|nr:G patch domain-containing 3 [Melia azedarach]
MAELSRQMAHYMLQEDDKQEKSWILDGSTQSTLWSPLRSNHESPKGPSTVIDPKAAFHSRKALIDDQIRAIQFYKLKHEQATKQLENRKQPKQYQNKRRGSVGFNDGQRTSVRSASPSSTSTPTAYSATQQPQSNQQQTGTGMRAVFLGGSGPKTKPCGTGVFLPKGIGYSSESRKKQGCSTVLIPARVVQALKQHFDKVGVPSRFNGSFAVENDALMSRTNSLYSQQQCQSRAVPTSNHQEMNLPHDWTY